MLFWGQQKDKNCTGNCTDERAKERNNICYTDDNADKNGIRHTESSHTDEAYNTDYERVKKSAVNEAANHFVSVAEIVNNGISCFYFE